MGVFFLQSYVEQRCPQAISNVDLRELASEFRISLKGPTNVVPKIIIDLEACIRPIYGHLDLICGGQGKIFEERWSIFISALESAGIEPVFVSDGSCVPATKRKTWIERKYKVLENNVIPIFDALAEGFTPNIDCNLLPGLQTPSLIREIFRKKIISSSSAKDADQVIAELADENTIGILSQDSDFLIYQYPEHVKYLSIKKFNFAALFNDRKTLKTISYSRRELVNCLDRVSRNLNPMMPRFEVGHLPLLACLTGNDVITKADLASFHQSLGVAGNNFFLAIDAVATFICQENFLPQRPSLASLEELCCKVFCFNLKKVPDLDISISGYFMIPFRPEATKGGMGISREPCLRSLSCNSWGLRHSSYYTDLFTDGNLRKYFPKPKAGNISPEAKHQEKSPENVHWENLVKLAESGSLIQHLMSGDPYGQGSSLEDPRSDDIPMSAKLFEKFRQRYYSVLFFEKPCQNGLDVEVVEYCMSCKGSLDEPVVQRIKNFPKAHPGLEALWNTEDRSIDPIRWKLFAYMISPELDFTLLQSLPDSSFIFPVCQLHIMQHDGQTPVLFKWEVELFLLEHLRFQNMTQQDFQEISSQLVTPDPRGVNLATLYTRTKVDIASKLVGKIVPVNNLMPLYSNFDGIHFQKMYNRYKFVGSHEADSHELEIVGFYFDLITNKGVHVRAKDALATITNK